MRILITGTPGTGKSSVSSIISRRKGWALLRLKDIAEKGCVIKKEGKEKIVDLGKLRSATLRELKGKKDAIIEGHLGCEFHLPVDFAFVLRTRPSALRRRLAKRGYPAGKIQVNLLSEMLDYCTQLSEQNYPHVLEVDTTGRSARETSIRILGYLEGRVRKLDRVGWKKELRKAALLHL